MLSQCLNKLKGVKPQKRSASHAQHSSVVSSSSNSIAHRAELFSFQMHELCQFYSKKQTAAKFIDLDLWKLSLLEVFGHQTPLTVITTLSQRHSTKSVQAKGM